MSTQFTDHICLRIIAGIDTEDDRTNLAAIFNISVDHSIYPMSTRHATYRAQLTEHACEYIARRLNNLSEGVQYAHDRGKR